ncbi:hypothetical protein [Luteimonas aquatica]|uniref:hypothetical protein n=1 Tax=Luteimonas aquatica TaxID=450364 RepID=UPI001F598EEA|nr:hypothetical protein [Luteimonas aquatica]
MRRFACAALLACLASPPFAAPAAEVPYKDLARIALLLREVDEQQVFAPSRFYAQPSGRGGKLPADFRIEAVVGREIVPLRVDADGTLHLPLRQDWADAGARLRVNQPKGTTTLGYSLRARPPQGTRMRYAQLTEAAQVMERGVREKAGPLRFLAPKVRALGIVFAPGRAEEIVLRLTDGTVKRFRTAAHGQGSGIELPWHPQWADAQATLSAPAVRIIPLME